MLEDAEEDDTLPFAPLSRSTAVGAESEVLNVPRVTQGLGFGVLGLVFRGLGFREGA